MARRKVEGNFPLESSWIDSMGEKEKREKNKKERKKGKERKRKVE